MQDIAKFFTIQMKKRQIHYYLEKETTRYTDQDELNLLVILVIQPKPSFTLHNQTRRTSSKGIMNPHGASSNQVI